MSEPNLLEIGRISKAHGLRGELVATLISDRPERVAPGAVWYLDEGPRSVVAIRSHQHRWIVTLSGVDTREDADLLHGQIIRGEPIVDDEAMWVHELVGASVQTPDGRSWGQVRAVVANPASDLLELSDGTLVPEVFVTDFSQLPQLVVIDPPVGLLEDDLAE